MKYIFTFIITFIFMGISIAQTYKVVADKIVGIVGDKIILKSDVYNDIDDRHRREESVPENAKCYIMEQILRMKAMVLQAEKDSIKIEPDELEAVLDNRLRIFAKRYGSEEAICDISGRTIQKIRDDFRQPIKEMMMIERLSNSISAGVKITPQEVKEYFAKKNPDSLPFYESAIEMGEIVVYPKASNELEELAIKELNDCREQIQSGRQKFDILARLYSDDQPTRELGGGLLVNRMEKAVEHSYLGPVFIAQVFRLKEGQISPVFKSRSGYHIVQMVKRAGNDASIRHFMRVPRVTYAEINESIRKLDSVRARLIARTITFGEAVAKYSEADSRLAGGIGSLIQLDQLDKETLLFLDQTKLKPGEFSKPMLFTDADGKQGARIVYLKNFTSPHRQNLKDDYDRIAEEALAMKKQRTIETWFAAKMPSYYYVMIDPEFNNCGTLRNWMQ